MRQITKIMITDYGMREFDWLGYKVSRSNPFSFHHIVKKENGGLYTYNNGAILTGGVGSSHEYLHIIEVKDNDLYVYLNNLLKTINDQRFMPTLNQLKAIRSILLQFEREHCSDRTKKGKLLIKPSYVEKRIGLKL